MRTALGSMALRSGIAVIVITVVAASYSATTATARVLPLVIPVGDCTLSGSCGAAGSTGPSGPTGVTGPSGVAGVSSQNGGPDVALTCPPPTAIDRIRPLRGLRSAPHAYAASDCGSGPPPPTNQPEEIRNRASVRCLEPNAATRLNEPPSSTVGLHGTRDPELAVWDRWHDPQCSERTVFRTSLHRAGKGRHLGDVVELQRTGESAVDVVHNGDDPESSERALPRRRYRYHQRKRDMDPAVDCNGRR